MVDEPDIIKQLREAEKIGLIESKVENSCEQLDYFEEAPDSLSDKTVCFIKDENQEMDECNEQYPSLFHHMINGFAYFEIVTDKKGKAVDYVFLDVNPSYEKLTDLKKRDIIGKKITEVQPGIENDPVDLIGRYGDVALQGKKREFEHYVQHLDKWFSIHAYSPKKGFFVTIIEDVSKRIKTQEKHRESEVRFKDLVEQSPISIQIIDSKGKTTRVNPSWKKLWGVTFKDLEGYNILKDKQLVDIGIMPYIERAFNGEAVVIPPAEYAAKKILGKGQTRWVSAIAYPVKNKSGEIKGITLIHQDVTENKKTEGIIRENEKKFRGLFESAPDAIILIDSTGHIQECNKAEEKLTGYSREEIIGKHVTDFFKEEWRQLHKKNFPILKKEGVVEAEINLVHKNGSIIPIWRRGTAIRDKEGEFAGALLYSRNITDRKHAGEIIQAGRNRANKQRSAIAVLAVDNAISSGDLPIAMRTLTQVSLEALQVERASIWLFSNNKKELRCIDLFEASTNKHSEESVLKAVDYPNYFKAMAAEGRINADDARADPRTSEFTDSYLVPLGITSMLDAGIMLNGELAGVVCLEHIGEKREWQSDEGSFVITVAALAAQTIVNAERKKAEKKLKESETRFKDISDVGGDWIWEVDKDGRYSYISGKFEQILGYKNDEIIGKTPSDFMDEKEVKRVGGIFKDIISKKADIVELENCVITKNGNKVYFLTNGKPILDKNSNLLGYRGIDKDITKHKNTEEQIKNQIKKSDLLNSLISKGVNARTIEQFFQDVVDDLLEKTDFDAGSIYIVDKQGTTASIICSKNIKKTFLNSIKTISINTSPYDAIFINKKSIFTDRYDKLQPDLSKISGFRSVVSIPILHKDKVIGALNFAKIQNDVTVDSEKEILRAVAIEVGDIYGRIEHKKDLEEKIDELSRWKKVTVGREIKMRNLKDRIKELECGLEK